MKKLEDIPNQNIFEVPDGYFDLLPHQIMERVQRKKSFFELPALKLSLRYALPVLILFLGLAYFLTPTTHHRPEEMLSTISTEHLIAYLNETDISLNDLLEVANLDDTDADSLNLKIQLKSLSEDFSGTEVKNELENEL